MLTFDISNYYYLRPKRIHSLKYLRSLTLKCKDIEIRKLEFVAKTQHQTPQGPKMNTETTLKLFTHPRI